MLLSCRWSSGQDVWFYGLGVANSKSLPSMPQWLGTQQKRTHWHLSLSAQRKFMIWQMRVFGLFTLNEYPCHVWIWSKKNYGREGANWTCLICRPTDRPHLFVRWQYLRALSGCQDRIEILLSSQEPADIYFWQSKLQIKTWMPV